MKIEVNQPPVYEDFDVGDIIKWGDNFYLVCREGQHYYLRNMKGSNHMSDYSYSLEDLIKRTHNLIGNITIYPSSKYKLTLEEM